MIILDVIESGKNENKDLNCDEGISSLVNFKENRYSIGFHNWRRNNEFSKSLKFLKTKNFNVNNEDDKLKTKFNQNTNTEFHTTIETTQESNRNISVIHPNQGINESEVKISSKYFVC